MQKRNRKRKPARLSSGKKPTKADYKWLVETFGGHMFEAIEKYLNRLQGFETASVDAVFEACGCVNEFRDRDDDECFEDYAERVLPTRAATDAAVGHWKLWCYYNELLTCVIDIVHLDRSPPELWAKKEDAK